ncbi:helix-turn-helix domain-containing protein [Streptomyces sp. NPDC055189]
MDEQGQRRAESGVGADSEGSEGSEGLGAAEYEFGAGILHVFGRQLKLCRLRVGMERAEFGALTGYSASTIASFEQGRRIAPPKFIDRADEVLDAGGVLKAGKEEVARAQYPAFFRDAARLEGEAVELHVYANQAVPGLLQTEEYARAVFMMMRPPMDEEIIEQRVCSRLTRQEILCGRPAPLVSFVIDEAVLRRPIGGRPVLRGQLEHILLTGQRRNVEVQVMPLAQEENAGMAGPFTLIETREGRRIAYVEVQNVSRLHTERQLVRALEVKYVIIRAQALTPRKSSAYVEKVLGKV